METDPHIYIQWAEDAEQSVIGGILIDNSKAVDVMDYLTPMDFFSAQHQLIYAAMMQLHEAGKPIDIVLLINLLTASGKLEEAGGMGYLAEMAQATPSTANVMAYAHIVKDKSREREVLSVTTSMRNEVMAEDGTSEERINNALAAVAALDFTESKERTFDHILREMVGSIEHRFNNKGELQGVSTGFSDIDKATLGLQKTDLIILAARPAMGKTTLAMNIASNVALNEPVGAVCVFSMEMGADQLAERLTASNGAVRLSAIRSGQLEDGEWTGLQAAMAKMKGKNLCIDDRPGLTPQQVRSKCLKEQRRHGKINLVVVDYLQLMKTGKSENRTQEVSEISRSLKGLAKEFNCPVIALSQLNRDLEKRSKDDRRPRVSDLRESGAIEQDADIIWFLYRDEVVNEESSRKGIAELEFAKYRAGELQTVYLKSQLHYSRFVNLTGSVPDIETGKSSGDWYNR